MSDLTVIPIPLLQDNYAYLLRDEITKTTAVVDPSTDDDVRREVLSRGWSLDYVLSTHHHGDHTGGNIGLRASLFGCKVVGPKADAARIAGLDIGVDEESGFILGSQKARVLFIPGHTRGHIAYYFEQAQALFCGDTLFSLGCGRLFEGTPAQMMASLGKLAALPGETRVYCGHEYTLSNAAFAMTVEPENEALKRRVEEARRLRARGLPTIPSRMGDERECNPFLRVRTVEEFAELRVRKDHFRV